MKNIIIALTAALAATLAFAQSPALAANDCTILCNGGFYATATPESLQTVLDAGAEVTATDNAGKTPLHWAAKATPEVFGALIAAGADVNAVDTLNRAPIHFISAASSGENIRLLLAAGADANVRTANNWTPLHGVAKFGTPENAMILMGAGADASLRNEMGEAPSDLAMTNTRMLDTAAFDFMEEAAAE